MASFRLEGRDHRQASRDRGLSAIGMSLLMIVSTLSVATTVPAQDSVQALAARVSGALPALADLVAQPTPSPGYANGNLAYLMSPAPWTVNTTASPTNFTPLTVGCTKGPHIYSFQASPEVGKPPLLVAFTVATDCTGNATWTFGDGNVSTQSGPNGSVTCGPNVCSWYNWTHIYRFMGGFVAQFSSMGGSTKVSDSTNVYVGTASISFQPSPEYRDHAPSKVSLSYETISAIGYSASWKFGDGNTSVQAGPNGSAGKGLTTYQWWNYTHTYRYLGSFIPQVTVTSSTYHTSARTNVYVSFVPSLFYSFYDEAPLIAKEITGSTYAIGLVEECNVSISDKVYQNDLNNFSSRFNISSTSLNFVGPGASSCSTNPALFWTPIETALDIEWAHVAAPGAKIYVCLDNTVNLTGLAACDHLFYLNKNLTQYNTMIVSNSWGYCATGADHYAPCQNGTDRYEGIWSQAKSVGMNLFASTGDFTPDSCSWANYDSSNPYGIAVGGTTITGVGSSGSYGSESVWANLSKLRPQCSVWVQNKAQESYGDWGETYGTSLYYPASLVPWQVPLLGKTNRSFPDVSMVANNSNGVPVLSQGAWYIVGGTSVGSPIWAGILDVLFQAGALPLSTFAAPWLYSQSACFHELNNPGTGRDGLGTPDVGCLAAA